MEIFIFILIYVGLLYVIYKFAESKNRESRQAKNNVFFKI